MREFELYGAAGAMVSVGDSINYLLEIQDLEKLFACVRRGLLPGGVFVFDFKTVHLYRDVIGNRTIAEDRGDCAFIWDNWYDPRPVSMNTTWPFLSRKARRLPIMTEVSSGASMRCTGRGATRQISSAWRRAKRDSNGPPCRMPIRAAK